VNPVRLTATGKTQQTAVLALRTKQRWGFAMASRDAVLDYMKSNYKISEEFKTQEGATSGLKLTFDVGDLRSQIIFLWFHMLQDGEEPWVDISSPFAKLENVNVSAVLTAAGNLVCGGVGLVGEHLVLKHAAPLANLDINELVRPMTLILHSADQLERQFAGGDEY
jgi:hypothetical protein